MNLKWIRTPAFLVLAGALAVIASRLAPTDAARTSDRRPLVAADRLDP